MLTEEELYNFNNELGIKHSFGEVLDVRDFEEHEDNCSSSDTGSDTSHSSDEVHDTRSFFIGYYRGPRKNREDSDDSEDYEEHFKMIKKPEEAHLYLQSNILMMPPNVEKVTQICLGKEHLLALVELKSLN